jgi:hypothetical protein
MTIFVLNPARQVWILMHILNAYTISSCQIRTALINIIQQGKEGAHVTIKKGYVNYLQTMDNPWPETLTTLSTQDTGRRQN